MHEPNATDDETALPVEKKPSPRNVDKEQRRLSRASLFCRIESHTIEKRETRKFRRSMQQHYSITFVMDVKDSEDHSTVKRTYQQFKSLHKQLRKKYPRAAIPSLPTMKTNRYDTRYVEQKYTELEKYLEDLLTLDTIASCELLRAFLDDCPLSDDSDDDEAPDHGVSTSIRIQKGKQPHNHISVDLGTFPGQSYSISLEIPCSNAEVAFQFSTLKSDVGFTITLNDTVLHMYSREESLKGTVVCPSSGLCVLTWDNSYAWRRSKTVTYRAEVILPTDCNAGSVVPSATNTSPGAIESDVRPTGYIEQVRRTMISPRQLVNRSMSKIGWSASNAFCIKAGPLIVQRRHASIKSRFAYVHQWYRKWFTLDGAHGILRYYDKEESVAREGPIAKLRVSSAKTTLDVTTAQTCPTPYTFQITSGKTTWVLCAEKEEDFVAWRSALATCIFLVRWNQNGGDQSMTQPSSDDNRSDDDDDDEEDDEEMGLLSPQGAIVDNIVVPSPSPCVVEKPKPPTPSQVISAPMWKPQSVVMWFLALNSSAAFVIYAPSMVVWTLVVVFNTVVICRMNTLL
ncbi:hypothetical protein AeMF1_019828 [Aphanomyces euteiches]|nr:hypothetical protein AeMF1_019828 [Aphanomyces euteiches]KAH9187742.1 hypothetical protein AeNC1_010278 [Aphanomyces euteiches]